MVKSDLEREDQIGIQFYAEVRTIREEQIGIRFSAEVTR
jgi:hypothetical protein